MVDDKILLNELLRKKKYELYRKHPLIWARDVLGSDPKMFKWSLWGEQYESHKWDGSQDPISTAWEALANEQWAAISAATGTSKTFSAAQICLWFLDCFEDSLVVTSAPKESQLTMNLWGEISKMMHKFKIARPNMYMTKLRLLPEGLNSQSPYSKSHQMIGFVAGVGAEEESATKAQGFHRKNMLFVLEEMAGMSPAVVNAFKQTCTSSNNLILALGNPDSEYDELFKFSKLPNVVSLRISAYDYPNVVLDKDVYSGAVTRKSIERRLLEYGEDSPMFQSRVRGMTPKNDANSLIKSEWVESCIISSSKFHGKKELQGFNGCGVDVSQSESYDKAAVAWFRNNTLIRIDEFKCDNATHLAYNLIYDDVHLMENNYANYNTGKVSDYDVLAQCIGVDSVGVGVATLNALRDLGYEVQSLSGGAWNDVIPTEFVEGVGEKALYRFQNLRSQMYWELREDFRNGNIIIDIDNPTILENIKRELTAIRYAKSDNAIAMEKKEMIRKRMGGKSPNIADAIAYANFMRKAYRFTGYETPLFF